jgi:hypothetical protein
MSHFTTVKKELGYHQVQVGQFQCRGYQGNQTTVDILIELQGGYDIGFVNRNSSFEMIADWYGIKGITEIDLSQKLNQKYSILSTKQELKNKGFSLKEKTLSNGTIRLIARKLG